MCVVDTTIVVLAGLGGTVVCEVSRVDATGVLPMKRREKDTYMAIKQHICMDTCNMGMYSTYITNNFHEHTNQLMKLPNFLWLWRT